MSGQGTSLLYPGSLTPVLRLAYIEHSVSGHVDCDYPPFRQEDGGQVRLAGKTHAATKALRFRLATANLPPSL